ncbi:MAG: protoporphyrinogen oxidase HemJ [Maricaulaceae bacterium]
MFDLYLWLKAFHLIAVIFWVAGLFMLPRFFAYHSGAEKGGELEAKMLVAEKRLSKIILGPAMIAAVIFGLILIGYNIEILKSSVWLYIKLIAVFGLVIYHSYLGKMRKLFAIGERPKSEKFFRMINEVPAIVTIIVVIMVIVRPF